MQTSFYPDFTLLLLRHRVVVLSLLLAFPVFFSDVTPGICSDPRVIGKVTLGELDPASIKVLQSRLILLEEFQPRQVPVPKEFSSWDAKKQSEWYENWKKSDEGKRFQAEEEKRFAKLNKYESKLDMQLGFLFRDVKPGNYELGGEVILKNGDRKFISEFYARVTVSDVEEVVLDRIDLTLVRLLEKGEPAPKIRLKNLDGKPVSLNTKKGNRTLIFFWTPGNATCQQIASQLKKSKLKKLQIIAIGVGKTEEQQKLIRESGLPGNCQVETLDSKVCRDYGVVELPSMFLISAKGKLLALPADFVEREFDVLRTLAELAAR